MAKAKLTRGRVLLLLDAQRRTGMGVKEFLRRMFQGADAEYQLSKAARRAQGILLFVEGAEGRFQVYGRVHNGRILFGTREDFATLGLAELCDDTDKGLMDAALGELEERQNRKPPSHGGQGEGGEDGNDSR
jgi:hypothetical protein